VPYAVGNKFGGHKAVEPELGTLDDFDWLAGEIKTRGMEVPLASTLIRHAVISDANLFGIAQAHQPFRLQAQVL